MSSKNPFEDQAGSYEEWFRVNDELYRSELDTVRLLLPVKGQGIEIGVGTGLFASELGIRYGVEPSSDMAEAARNKGITVWEGRAEDIPVNDSEFDFALMVTVDCFLDDVTTAFKEVRRILKDKGELIIAFLDRETKLGQGYEKNKHLSNSYKYANFHSTHEMRSLLENTGFTVVDSKQTIFSLDNKYQQPEPGTGKGVFAVFKAVKKSESSIGDHAHTHIHSHNDQGNIKIAFFLNLFFTIIEIAGGLFTNSVAILSDALHDLGDTFSLGLAWYLSRYSRKSPDNRYSFGYARFSLLGALANGLILAGGSTLILIKAIPRLMDPEKVNADGMLVLAVLGIAVNGFAALRLIKGSSLNEKVVSWHLIEDVLGWVVVLIAGVVMKFIDAPVIDPVLSILITLFVLFNVFKNLREVLKIFLQRVPDSVSITDIEQDISTLSGVGSVHHTHVWSLEGEKNLMSTHVIVPDNTSSGKITLLKREIRAMMRERGIGHVTIEVDFQSEGCDEVSCK